jgi:hypothetical protein
MGLMSYHSTWRCVAIDKQSKELTFPVIDFKGLH